MLVKLYHPAVVLFVLLQTAVVHFGSVQATTSAETCEAQVTNPPWNRMEVLPGTGWDNLRNLDMGLVFEYDYTQCQLTNDRKYLLPDGYFAIPVQQSNVETLSELIDHWDNHTSLTGYSINVAVSGFYSDIEGKFSTDYITAKTNMYSKNQKTIVTRVQIRQKLYIVRLQPGTNLHPTFKTRLLEIAAHMMNNNSQIAHYLSELLVRDYGTHYLTVAHAGGILVQEDYIRNNDETIFEENSQKVTASASASFFGVIGFSSSFTYFKDDTFLDSYLSNRTYSHIRTFGGPPYRINFTINDWEDGLPDSVVTIDREGVPLHFAIIPEVLTELPPAQTLELAHYVEKAINLYYKHNTRLGCTNPNARNFYFGANVDDGSCKAPSDNFTFGGVYQTCTHTPTDDRDIICPDLEQKNPLTGDYSCLPGYEAVLLHSGAKSGSYITQACHQHCRHFIIKYDCHTDCYNVNNPVTGHYQTYWCVDTGRVHDNSGYMFGGLYSSIAVNPLTRTKSCPNHFYPLRFGEDTHICVSDDYELGYGLSIPFAGFESCSAGNPLATKSSSGELKMNLGVLKVDPSSWPHRCPTGYTQHLASMEQSCEINYCVKAGTLGENGLPPVKLPPYRKYPNLNPNLYNVMSIVSAKGNLWQKDNETNEWRMMTVVEREGLTPAAMDLQPAYYDITNASRVTSDTTNNSHHDGNSSTTAALIISTTALLGLLIAGVVFVVYKYKGRKPKTKHHSGYRDIGNTDATTDATISNELQADV